MAIRGEAVKEKLQQYALIAEVVSALAVILTLVILILEVRENTEVTKMAAYQSQLEIFNVWRTDITGDESKLEVFNEYLAGELPEPSSVAELKLTMTLNSLWSNYERGYISYVSGIIDGDQWVRIERSMCDAYSRLSRPSNQSIKDSIYFRLSPEFTDFAELTC